MMQSKLWLNQTIRLLLCRLDTRRPRMQITHKPTLHATQRFTPTIRRGWPKTGASQSGELEDAPVHKPNHACEKSRCCCLSPGHRLDPTEFPVKPVHISQQTFLARPIGSPIVVDHGASCGWAEACPQSR